MSAVHVSSTVLPTGVTRPRPVITTRRVKSELLGKSLSLAADERGQTHICAYSRSSAAKFLLLVLVDVVISVPHTLNLLSIFVGNFNAKLFFKTHHEFDRVQRVGAEVVDKSRVWRDFVLIDTKLIDDNLFYLVLDLLIGHRVCSSVSLIKLLNLRGKSSSCCLHACCIFHVQHLHVATDLTHKT